VAGIWLGNDDNSPMRNVTGGSIPALMWKRLMTGLEKGHPPRPLDRTPGPPPGLEAMPQDSLAVFDSDESVSTSAADMNQVALLAPAIREERNILPEPALTQTLDSPALRPEPPQLPVVSPTPPVEFAPPPPAAVAIPDPPVMVAPQSQPAFDATLGSSGIP
ncbi:MAG: hypothetical protein JO256_12400, partial [Alphaproteobacteria bacterium]|nr:hypothetical protein [Alphaproteobacteria bacterium]